MNRKLIHWLGLTGVTALVVLLSIASLVTMILAGFRKGGMRGLGFWAAIALGMMLIGSVGTGVVPPQYFGIVERFSVFAAVGFNAVLGMYLLEGFRMAHTTKED